MQDDQIVSLSSEPDKEYTVRALAASAYRHGGELRRRDADLDPVGARRDPS